MLIKLWFKSGVEKVRMEEMRTSGKLNKTQNKTRNGVKLFQDDKSLLSSCFSCAYTCVAVL